MRWTQSPPQLLTRTLRSMLVSCEPGSAKSDVVAAAAFLAAASRDGDSRDGGCDGSAPSTFWGGSAERIEATALLSAYEASPSSTIRSWFGIRDGSLGAE